MNIEAKLTGPTAVKLTVDNYLMLAEAGALEKHGNTELINGVIYSMSPQHAEHYTVKVRLLRRLADACDALGQGLEAWSEGSIDMSPHSVPLPDVFITNETPRKGLTRPETVVLAVEVAGTTLRFDLGEKAKLYAAQSVPEYWVIDIEGRILHQMWEPSPDGYGQRREAKLGQRIEAVTIAGLTVGTDGI